LREIAAFDNPLAWARAQPEYPGIEQKRRKKVQATTGHEKLRKPERTTSDRPALQRLQHLQSEIQAAEDFIRQAKKEIAELRSRLDEHG